MLYHALMSLIHNILKNEKNNNKVYIRLSELHLQCHWNHIQVSNPSREWPSPLLHSDQWRVIRAPPAGQSLHYLSLLAILCQTQNCWSKWRTPGRRHCQSWTRLRCKHIATVIFAVTWATGGAQHPPCEHDARLQHCTSNLVLHLLPICLP